MGYDINRFVGQVDEEIICSICKDVVEDPVQSNQCEHVFCKQCIGSWMEYEQTCPIDRNPMQPEHLVGVNRIMRVLLSRHKIKCIYAESGCQMELSLDSINAHEVCCEHDPNAMALCDNGCGLFIARHELGQHNCVSMLRMQLKMQQDHIRCTNNELVYLNNYISSKRSTMDSHALEDLDRQLLTGWATTFPFAMVRNWSHFISTPDPTMQSALSTSLRQSACPRQIIKRLVCSSQEHSWPKDLVTLAKLANRHVLNNIDIRLLRPLSSGESCVLMWQNDNMHMEPNLLPSDAIVIIFTDGVTEENEDFPISDHFEE